MIEKLRSSITVKIAVLVAGGTSAIFALVLAYSYAFSRRIILEDAEKDAMSLTTSVARRIEQEFRAVEKVPRGLAHFIETSPFDTATLSLMLQRTVQENPELFGAGVAFEPHAFDSGLKYFCPYCYRAPDGLSLAHLGSESYNYFQYDWYHIPREMLVPTWSQPYMDKGGGNILMATYSFPFFTRNVDGTRGAFKGVIAADVSLGWLTKLVSSVQVVRTGYCFIISNTGTFVTHPKSEWIMCESVFSLSEEYGDPKLRAIGRNMIRKKTGLDELCSTLTQEEAFIAHSPIPSTGWVLAAVFPKRELLEEVEVLHRMTLLLAGVGVLLLALVGMLVGRSIARPLRRMAKVSAEVAEGNLDVDLSYIKSTDEVGKLARAFTHMAAGLRDRDFIRDTFGRYLTKEVVNRLLESKDGLRLGGETREITLLMSDLRGFTALTANMSAEQVITFLNRYLGKMLEILLVHRGTIDEIIGDGILAFFGAPETLEDHSERAVACALRMQEAMEEINVLNEAEGLPHLEMGAAVHTGQVVVGNIGSEKRSKYGAVGFQVNFTGRVESFTVGGQVLISQATYERLSNRLQIRQVLHVEMKGVPGEVALYDVRGIGAPYNIHLQERDQTPLPLETPISACVQRMERKAVTGRETAFDGVITHVSRTGAKILLKQQLGIWDDIRILLLDDQLEPLPGGVYGKIVSVAGDAEHYEAVVRFTSISPEAFQRFRSRKGG